MKPFECVAHSVPFLAHLSLRSHGSTTDDITWGFKRLVSGTLAGGLMSLKPVRLDLTRD